MNDVWVCDSCRSINRMRDSECYHCRAPRSNAMETPGLDLRADNAALERSARTYVISWPLALITVALLVAVAVLGIIVLKLQVDDYPRLRQAFVDAIANGSTRFELAMSVESVQAALLGAVRFGLVLLALLTFAGWLALVTRNVPLLGGGVPSRNPVRVFIFTVIPLWQLLKVPGMIQDVLYRTDPREGGAFMVLAAWLGLVGSVFVSVLGNWAITSVAINSLIAAAPAHDDAALLAIFGGTLDQEFWLAAVVEVMIAFGTIVLAGIMIRIESRCAARDREIREKMAATGAPTPPAGPDWSTPGPVAGTGGAAGVAAAPSSVSASSPYEPNWPAGRPWPGSASASGSTSSSPSIPPPPPPDAPRLG
ncbi:MAG: hypothetical protein ACYDAN_11815 [Candidatus Limnocylindrales bacterium]